MMTLLDLRFAFLATVLGFSTPVASGDDELRPRFLPGTPDVLEVDVVDDKAGARTGVLSVEVRNRGRAWAEPLAFEVVLESTKKNSKLVQRHRLQRVPVPLAGRAGRAVRPGRTERWWLPRPFTGDEKVRWHVWVIAASFFDGPGFTECPATLGELVDSRAELKNQSQYPVRVLLRSPAEDGRVRLFAEDLGPDEERRIGADARPAMMADLPQDLPPVHGELDELEIVDWSVLVDTRSEVGRNRLEAAWEVAARWAEPQPVLRGEVQYVMEGQSWSLPSDGFRGRASFALHPGDGVRLDSKRELDDRERSALVYGIGSAFAPLRRPDFATWARGREFQIDGDEPLRVFVPSTPGGNGAFSLLSIHEIVGGRIVRSFSPGVDSRLEEVYRDVPAPDGRALRVFAEQAQVSFERRWLQQRSTWKHAFTDGLPWVQEYLEERFGFDNEPTGRLQLTIEEVRFEAARDRSAAPTGSGVDALRAAWEQGYRYPEGMDVRARFTVSTPQKPSEWLSRRQTNGRVRFEGWRGGVPCCASFDVDVDRVRGEEAESLASIFQARTSIWCRQDPAGRRPFREVFAGAVIEPRPNRPGLFDVEHREIREVRVRDGRVAAMALQDGRHREIDWAMRHGELVPIEVRERFGDRTSRVGLKWGKLEAQASEPVRLFPTELEIEDWFYEGWGPETYQFVPRSP